MLRFRPRRLQTTAPLTPEAVRALLADVTAPAHFYLPGSLQLAWEQREEETAWEIFRGRLLDPAHTRERRRFEAWNLYAHDEQGWSVEPLLSAKLDAAAGVVHVVRAVHCYVWEGYHAGDNVYRSREIRKWVRELVGTAILGDFADLDELRDELICLLFHAVVGTSRLPLTSVEAPLPAFSFGQLAYCYRAMLPDTQRFQPMTAAVQLTANLQRELARPEPVKLLEALIRSVSNPHEIIAAWQQGGPAVAALPGLMRALFNEVALSPYTDFVDRTLALWRTLVQQHLLTIEEFVDFLSYLLRQVVRHLTAYDLVRFHHRGANYPDALLLDAALKEYLRLAEAVPALFRAEDARARRRRRALRQGWLLRRRYEGHPVPDAPTSPGENARVLPAPYARVPEAQILSPAERTKRLYENDPLSPPDELLFQCIADLGHDDELRELGTAVFLDRPLGFGKASGEPDLTPLLAYEAFSRSIAEERLRLLPLSDTEGEVLRQRLASLAVTGIPAATVAEQERPGAVSLADALKAADDFVLVRTLRQGLRELATLLRIHAAVDVADQVEALRLVVGRQSGAKVVLSGYDEQLRPCWQRSTEPTAASDTAP